jgi:hypothetical protein
MAMRECPLLYCFATFGWPPMAIICAFDHAVSFFSFRSLRLAQQRKHNRGKNKNKGDEIRIK